MLARFADVIYWLGVAIAALMALLAFFGNEVAWMLAVVIGIPAFVIGWATRYILKGSTALR